jgi:hypothetical protein
MNVSVIMGARAAVAIFKTKLLTCKMHAGVTVMNGDAAIPGIRSIFAAIFEK